MTDTVLQKQIRNAIQIGLNKAMGIHVEEEIPSAIEPGTDYSALNAVFHKVSDDLITFTKGVVKFGHNLDPKIGGHIDSAEAKRVDGTFQLLLINIHDERFQIPVGTLTTSPTGFPVTLSFPQTDSNHEGGYTARNDSELVPILKRMVADYHFGSAVLAMINHRHTAVHTTLQ